MRRWSSPGGTCSGPCAPGSPTANRAGSPSRTLPTADRSTLTVHDPVAIRSEAWIQAQTLSKIVLEKYYGFRSALTFSTIAVLGWQLVVP